MSPHQRRVAVVASGYLDGQAVGLAVRVALALPLGGADVQVYLVDAGCSLALPGGARPGSWGGAADQEFEALLEDEDVQLWVEEESLHRLGLAGEPLRAGIGRLSRDAMLGQLRAADHCLVF